MLAGAPIRLTRLPVVARPSVTVYAHRLQYDRRQERRAEALRQAAEVALPERRALAQDLKWLPGLTTASSLSPIPRRTQAVGQSRT